MKNNKSQKKNFADRLDGFLGFFSPKTAYKRRAYRKAFNMLSAYKGADVSRLRTSWIPGKGSADQDLLPELARLRERSRDLNRNDAHASGITGTMVTNVVGVGIKPQSRIDYESISIPPEEAIIFQKKAERAWQKWTPFADAEDRMDFYEIQQLVERQILENGEAIILPVMLKEKTRPYMLAFDVIESDRLDEGTGKASNIRYGVEIGKRGEPVAYWIRKTHPGDYQFRLGYSSESIRIPAWNEYGRPNILHLYWVLRPGQTRGIPFFAPVMNIFKDLADYLEAEVVAARIAACFAIFVETEGDPLDVATGRSGSTNANNQKLESLEPGMIEYLARGEKINSFKPERPGVTFEPFVDRILRAISAALGLPYELVAKDFSKTNYSSARAALLEARRFFKCRQEWLSRRLCQPAWDMLIEEAYLKGELEAPGFYKKQLDWCRVKWITPGWQWVDPLKEVKASKESIDSRLSSLSDECAAQGKDWEEVLEQIKREEDKKKELSLLDVKSSSYIKVGDKDEEEINGSE